MKTLQHPTLRVKELEARIEGMRCKAGRPW